MSLFKRSSDAPKRSGLEKLVMDFEPFFAGLPMPEQYGGMELVRAIMNVTGRCSFEKLSGGLFKFVMKLVPLSSGKHVGERLLIALDQFSPTFRARFIEKFGSADWEKRINDARRTSALP